MELSNNVYIHVCDIHVLIVLQESDKITEQVL